MPVGIPADENLRILRTEAHHYLNYFMQAAGMDYKAAYQTVSDITGLPVSMCHISMMDEVQCRPYGTDKPTKAEENGKSDRLLLI